jgi:hypothetical protein
MTTLTTNQVLEVGTTVKVGSKVGKVLSSKYVNAVPCGTVVIHRIELTHKNVRVSGNTYKMVSLPKSEIVEPNYAFVSVV